jgi:STE24 endopeptidase
VTRRALERLGARPVLGGAAAAAGLSITVAVVTVPFGIWAHERSVDVGLSTQSLGGYLSDWVKASAIAAILAAGVGTLALALIRRFRRRWWIPGSVALWIGAAVITWLAPVVIAPLFNKFKELPPGQARTDVLDLARRAGVDVGHVYEVDASRRTTAINAYVNGIGSSKRVVLYDTLLKDLNRGERNSVVAHELGHVHGNDIRRGLIFVAIVTPLSLIFISVMAGAIARRRGIEPGQPAYLPAFALAIALTSLVIGIPGNQLSRAVEARADTFSLQLTNDPKGMIGLQQQLADRNLADPDPPGLYTFVFGTHPPTIDRIGSALAWQQGERP